MIGWAQFPYFAGLSIVCWTAAALVRVVPSLRAVHFSGLLRDALVLVGILVLSTFVALLGLSLERPPFRTLGETRLWYALLLAICGYVVEKRWRTGWLCEYSLLMSGVFLVINLCYPEAHDKTLMPALQSPWFVPHVVVYLIGYAMLGASFLIGLHGTGLCWWRTGDVDAHVRVRVAGDNSILIGFVFLTFGLVFGAFWAKEAWGHYWMWDPKETWSLLTWLAYLIYLHLTTRAGMTHRFAFSFMAIAFVVLLFCWFGVSYLPSAQQSVHGYAG